METEPWATLASKYWLNQTPSSRIPSDALKTELWDPLESDGFSARALSTLDSLSILEKFLWPTFASESSNLHVVLISVFSNFRQRGGLDYWTTFEQRPTQYPSFFRRLLQLNLDSSLAPTSRIAVLTYVAGAFRSLERDLVRKECAPLVSIGIWHNLHNDAARDEQLSHAGRRKAWKSYQKRYEAADADGQARARFERSWLFSMLLGFLGKANKALSSSADTTWCEFFLEFLVDVSSQLPTRRYTKALIQDMNVSPILARSAMQNTTSSLLHDMATLLDHFLGHDVDESDSVDPISDAVQAKHNKELAQFQRTAYHHYEQKLKILAMSNLASIEQRRELEQLLTPLTDQEMESLCGVVGLRTQYPTNDIPTGRGLWQEVIVHKFSRPQSLRELVGRLTVSPNESVLYNSNLLRNNTYDGSKPLAVPKLGLQYLSLADFLWRSFQLYQSEAFNSIRNDLESVVKRMKPRQGKERNATVFDGVSKMAMPIDKLAIIEAAPPNIGTTQPAYIRGEVILDVGRLNESMRREWDSLRPKDSVFLLHVKGPVLPNGSLTNGHKTDSSAPESVIARVRTAEVVQILDDNGRALRETANGNGFMSRAGKRHVLLNLDPSAYEADKGASSKEKTGIYESVNVIVRRQGRENNFKPVLENIQQLVQTSTALPSWLREVFLGYGDPKGASFSSEDGIQSVDFLDTFLDWEHLGESFPNRKLEVENSQELQIAPPYVLESSSSTIDAPVNPKKRRREQMEEDDTNPGPVRVHTYMPRNTGPYPVDTPKKNAVRFTSKQVEAIVAGTQPGLSLVVGPPGTGKTDVATQIINLLYHNNPSERILLIAHSNQALNQLFQKITNLDIDGRHLLRLGRGEEELDMEASYSKSGRVDSFLENRQRYLAEVTRLAASLDAAGAHGSSCETAEYFNQVFVQPALSRFWAAANLAEATSETIAAAFPFSRYFSNAPVAELFPAGSSVEDAREVAKGCQYHLVKIFSELKSIRPFEILRHPRDQANHLLVKEARVIAMTSTHAAINRSEIASLGFYYSTLIMEEAAQITEIESFIPLALQNPDPKTNSLPLKRIVLIGDHNQNVPIIQSVPLKQYANLDQSLFHRFIRLGVPATTLDAQGRCRPSLARLFAWRYPTLTNLPHLSQTPEFLLANAGFKYTSQFIDVSTYNSVPVSEREPTPHFIQNIAEAEYAVALFQYMRLLGYPASSITILATYAGQRALIRDVLGHRCKGNKLFGLPKAVSTVDRYQGEQNDYIILSLVRTKSVGYLRDVRRLTVALSRARLGFYVLGSLPLWESAVEMQPAMEVLLEGGRESNLVVTTGETFPCTYRKETPDEAVTGVDIVGVEHLGQYVYEMTQAKVKSMGGKVEVEVEMREDREVGEEEELD